MPEYIEREALIVDIAETVMFTVKGGASLPTSEMRGANKVVDRIKSAPTADVVEVVRCKDCKYYEIHKPSVTLNCERNGRLIPMMPDDFCSYGERKDVSNA